MKDLVRMWVQREASGAIDSPGAFAARIRQQLPRSPNSSPPPAKMNITAETPFCLRASRRLMRSARTPRTTSIKPTLRHSRSTFARVPPRRRASSPCLPSAVLVEGVIAGETIRGTSWRRDSVVEPPVKDLTALRQRAHRDRDCATLVRDRFEMGATFGSSSRCCTRATLAVSHGTQSPRALQIAR